MADNNVFVLDDGTKEISIKNKYNEEICKIRIRSGDMSILDRYNAFTDGFNEMLEPLQDVQLNNDGTSNFDDDWKVIKSVERNIIQRMNEIFDTQDIGKLFEKRNAFSTIGGEFYIEKVMTMLGEVVAKGIEEESKKSQARLNKYLSDLK